jgi:hypothetical protein
MRYIPPRKAMPSAEYSLKKEPVERYLEGDKSGGYYYEESETEYEKEEEEKDNSDD